MDQKLDDFFGLSSFLATLILLIFFAILVPSRTVQAEDEATLEGFKIFRYSEGEKENLSWKLSGKRAEREGSVLLVREFELSIFKPDSRGTALYELSGRTIRLIEEEDEEIAVMNGEVEIEIEDELNLIAGEVRYNFADREISGAELNFTRTWGEKRFSFGGSSFRYDSTDEALVITEGFEVDVSGPGSEKSRLTGGKLIWNRGKDIKMSGDFSASFSSGWKLTAREVEWKPRQLLLTAGSSAKLKNNETTITGQKLTYDGEKEKISVSQGKMRLETL
ncbi:hypothetical protein K9M06_05095 [Candidatus Bipolaricaulota bacterium]|nr:hypothetical protein [Candidatus Bipolaricaulota bacterium]